MFMKKTFLIQGKLQVFSLLNPCEKRTVESVLTVKEDCKFSFPKLSPQKVTSYSEYYQSISQSLHSKEEQVCSRRTLLIILCNFGQVVPVSVCNDNCYPGFHKKKKEGEKFCCYACTPCPGGMISYQKGRRHNGNFL